MQEGFPLSSSYSVTDQHFKINAMPAVRCNSCCHDFSVENGRSVWVCVCVYPVRLALTHINIVGIDVVRAVHFWNGTQNNASFITCGRKNG